MSPIVTRIALACTATLTLALPAASLAAPTTHSGAFTRDDDLFVLDFTLAGTSQVRGVTTSFAQGGFAPVLSVFGAGGLLVQAVGSSRSCGADSGAADPATGFCWDALFDTTLSGGDYTLVLSQDDNLALGDALADGFTHDGQADYTGVIFLGQPGARFINADGSPRTGQWSLDWTIETLHVPEPATLALLLAALSLALLPARRPGPRG